MKAILVGDPHATADELGDCRALMSFVLRKCRETDTKTVILLGDLFHTHAVVHVEVLAFWNNCVEGLLDRGIESMALVGNHDRPGNHDSKANALMGVSHLKVVDRPEVIEGVLFHPYTPNHIDFVEACRSFVGGVVVCHQTFSGSTFENGFYAQDGINPDEIRQQIVSGHIHAPQKFANVWYPGAPRWRTLSDANVDRHIHLVDLRSDGYALLGSFSTGEVCRRTHALEVTPESPDVPDGISGDVRVDIRGPSSWVDDKKDEMLARGFKVRTFPIAEKQISIRESDGIRIALNKFVDSWVPENGTSQDLLRKTIEHRFET